MFYSKYSGNGNIVALMYIVALMWPDCTDAK